VLGFYILLETRSQKLLFALGTPNLRLRSVRDLRKPQTLERGDTPPPTVFPLAVQWLDFAAVNEEVEGLGNQFRNQDDMVKKYSGETLYIS
jgi:hypothetical protein